MKKIECQIDAIAKRAHDKEMEYESAIAKAEAQLSTAQARLEEAQAAIDHDQYVSADDAIRCATRDLKFYQTGLNKVRETPEASREEIQKITDMIRKEEKDIVESCTAQIREHVRQLLSACEELQQLVSTNDRLREKWSRNVMKEKTPQDRSIEARIFIGQMSGVVKGLSNKVDYVFDNRETLFGNMF